MIIVSYNRKRMYLDETERIKNEKIIKRLFRRKYDI